MAETFFRQTAIEKDAAPLIGWRTPALVVAGAGLVAVCAHISIPLGFTPVPLTMQTFAVLLLGLLFSPRVGFATMALYLAEGAAGLPVFSPAAGSAGIAQLLGPTGGYLLCYPFAAALAGMLYRARRRSFPAALGAGLAGSILILAGGALWLGILTRAELWTLLGQSVLPFLPGDSIKAVAAALCIYTLNSFRASSKP